MIRLTTGPETWLPKPACSTTDTTTYFGLPAGAYAANQENGCLPAISADPVFAATETWLSGQPMNGKTAVPRTGTCASARCTYEISDLVACSRERTCGLTVLNGVPSGFMIFRPTCGRRTRPPFAIAAYP